MITVFTPTYNRANLLPRLYESLKKQTFKDFEWLIVDDGSADGTRDLVGRWIKEKLIDIRYYCQENGGKHRAINRGAQLAKGEWFFIVDSDDYLPDNSLEIAIKWIDTIKSDDSFAGICGVKKDVNGVLNLDFSFEKLDVSPLRIGEFTKGDKAEIFRTAILKEYPFPDISGEKFCAEGLIWSRIGLRYKLRYFNEVIYFCEYLDGGLSNWVIKNRRQSPCYTLLLYREQMSYATSMKNKIRAAINYWRFAGFAKDYSVYIGVPIYSYLLLPAGVFMLLRDSYSLSTK